eukprot:2195507-Rhodomonas_salina.1
MAASTAAGAVSRGRLRLRLRWRGSRSEVSEDASSLSESCWSFCSLFWREGDSSGLPLGVGGGMEDELEEEIWLDLVARSRAS